MEVELVTIKEAAPRLELSPFALSLRLERLGIEPLKRIGRARVYDFQTLRTLAPIIQRRLRIDSAL